MQKVDKSMQLRTQSRPPSAMGFDEEIEDSPGLAREFVKLYHHRIPFRRWREIKKLSVRGAAIGFLGISYRAGGV